MGLRSVNIQGNHGKWGTRGRLNTVFLVEVFDLPDITPFFVDVIVELIPELLAGDERGNASGRANHNVAAASFGPGNLESGWK